MSQKIEILIADAEAMMDGGETDLGRIDAIISEFESYGWYEIGFDLKKRIRAFADWALETTNTVER